MQRLMYLHRGYRCGFYGLLAIAITFTLAGCRSFLNQIIVEEDIAKSSKRVKTVFYHNRSIEYPTAFSSLQQTFLKEIYLLEQPRYFVYDRLHLSSDAYPLEDSVYFLIDNSAIPIGFTSKDLELQNTISEQTDDIVTADSSSVSVVTGYTQNSYKQIRISYQLNTSIINRLSAASDVAIRYYAGPDMMTVSWSKEELDRMKELIHTSR